MLVSGNWAGTETLSCHDGGETCYGPNEHLPLSANKTCTKKEMSGGPKEVVRGQQSPVNININKDAAPMTAPLVLA